MKRVYFLTALLSLFVVTSQAQFIDDMQYEQGEDLGLWWIDAQPPTSSSIWISDGNPLSGDKSGFIGPDSFQEQELSLGNKTSGTWSLEYYMYVPAGATGYMIFLDDVPFHTGSNFVLGNIYFNNAGGAPGTGEIPIPTVGTVFFDYPEDDWFQLIWNFDLTNGMSQATFEMIVDGDVAVPAGSPWMLSGGGTPLSLGGIVYYSIDSNTNEWFDDFKYVEGFTQPDAQFTDDMEYPGGIPEDNSWWYCPEGNTCDIVISTDEALSGDYSGYIPDDGSTTQLLSFANRTFGTHAFELYMYVPSGSEAAFTVRDAVTGGSSNSIVGNVFFNQGGADPGEGVVENSAVGAVPFNFPHDEWFKVGANIDLSEGMDQATWEFVVDGADVISAGTPFTNSAGDVPTSLGGIEFYSASSSTGYYLDDFIYTEGSLILGSNDFTEMNFSVIPNPVDDVLQIETQFSIDAIQIFSLLGHLVNQKLSSNRINVSDLSQGLYFVRVRSANRSSVQKFVKR